MDMIERVARAIKSEIGEQWDAQPLPGANNPEDWSATGGTLDLITVARAAIEAMREPTEEMLYAGYKGCGVSSEALLVTEFRQGYRAAVNAALNKQGGR